MILSVSATIEPLECFPFVLDSSSAGISSKGKKKIPPVYSLPQKGPESPDLFYCF